MFCWENEVEMILISSAEIDIIGHSFAFSFLFITPTKSWYFHISLPFCDQILNSPIIILWSLKSFYLQGGDYWRVCQRGGRLHCSQRNPHIWAVWNWERGNNGGIRFNILTLITCRSGWRLWTTTSGSRTRSSSSSWRCCKVMEMGRWSWVGPASWRSPSSTMTVSLMDYQEVSIFAQFQTRGVSSLRSAVI